jgi:hypothetical protein
MNNINLAWIEFTIWLLVGIALILLSNKRLLKRLLKRLHNKINFSSGFSRVLGYLGCFIIFYSLYMLLLDRAFEM